MLTVRIENDAIIIKLPLDTLKMATEYCGELATFDEAKNDWRKVEVTDLQEWAKAVVHELEREEEDGSTAITRMLDKAFEQAVEQGAEGIGIEGVL